jgi:glutamine transport system substrate-binding protein
MKIFIKLVLASILALSTIYASEKIIVATDTSFVPFEYRQGNSYVGFDIDMLKAISKELNMPYELRPMDFVGIIPALQTGQVDMALAGITIKESRKKVIDFSNGYYDSGFLLMVRKNSKINGVSDLVGKSIAVKLGTSAADYAKANFKKTKIILFPNINDAYLALQTGRVDAAMHDTPNVLYYIKEAGKGRVKTVGKQMMAQQYGIAFPKGSKLVQKVNTVLKNMKNDGRYNAIYKKWFGTTPPAK